MDNPEKVATYGTQEEEKHNTICVGHHYTQTNTNNINKTWALLQTTGGKDERTVLMLKSYWTSQHETQSRSNIDVGKWITDCLYIKNMIVPILYMNGTCNWIISCKVDIFYADVKTKMAVAAGFVFKIGPYGKKNNSILFNVEFVFLVF